MASECEHMRCEEHCVTEINGAGVHREYWLQCVDCGETFDEHPRADCEGCGDPKCPCNTAEESL